MTSGMVTTTDPAPLAIEVADLRAMMARQRILIARYDAESDSLRAVIESLRRERCAVEELLGRGVVTGQLAAAVRDALGRSA